MYGLAQWIPHFQETNDSAGENLDHGNLEPEPEILHLRSQRFAFVEQDLGPQRQRMQALQQRRGRMALAEGFDGGARRLERVARKVDAVEGAIVLAAILQMIVELQARAERVGGGPGRRALAVDV